MSELTLTIIRLGLLVLLWLFVFSVAGVLRGDLYGTRVVPRTPRKQQPARRPAQPPAPKQPAQAKPRRAARNEPRSLAVTEGPLSGTTLSLKDSGTLIGRNPECALVLDDDFASGRHARIYRGAEGRWLVEDLGSTNGTFLGQQKLTAPAPVEAGSLLRIGKTVIELRK
jgi:pSer/pThr/pTyr-binding forkhead associated (FHA) protein